MRTSGLLVAGVVLALAAVAEAREEIIYFEKEFTEGWAIRPDGTNERKLYEKGSYYGTFQAYVAAIQSSGWSWQDQPKGVTLGLDRREGADGASEWALVKITDGVREVVTPFGDDIVVASVAEDGQRIVFMREGSLQTGFKVWIRDASGDIRYLTTAKRGVGFAWIRDAAPKPDGALAVERLPAEMSVRGAYGSFFASDRDREVSEDMARRFQLLNLVGLQVNGVGRLPFDRMSAADLKSIDQGLGAAHDLMARSPFKYGIVPQIANGACVASAQARSRDLSTRLGGSWTVTSHGVTIGGPAAHHYSVASFWGEDGTAYHFAMDSYLHDADITYLGSSGEGFPKVWGWLDQERTAENAFYREGQALTHLDGVPVEAVRYDRAALENVRQANARLTAVTWREVTADPARATRFGRTYLPFRLVARDPATQQPLADALVQVSVTVDGPTPGDRPGLSLEKLPPGEVTPPQATLHLRADAAGRTPIIYLRVDDPYLTDTTTVGVQASVNGGAAERISWEVLDNLKELEARFKAAFPAGVSSSAHERAVEGGPLERAPFMSDVVLRRLGDDGSAYTVDRVLSLLSSIAFDPESAYLLNGLHYHPVWVRDRGALHFATAVYPDRDATGSASKHGRVLDAGATRSPVAWEPSAWTARFGGPDAEVALEGGLGDGPAEPQPHITALVSCPVEVLFKDAEGRRVGFADGSYVNELPAPLSHTRQDLPEADGTTAKLVTYADRKGTLTVVGQADGTFSLDLLFHQPDGSALWVEFVQVPIAAGETVTFPVDGASPDQPGERSGGGLVFAAGPATRISPPAPPGGRRGRGGCSLGPSSADAPSALPAAALALLALGLARRRRAS